MALLSVRTSASSTALALVAFLVAAGTLFGVGLPSAAADVTTVTGSAFNYSTEVSLAGEPAEIRGFGQPDEAPRVAASPSVACPADGGFHSVTDPDGARAAYGPSVIIGGIWPDDARSAPPSGPMTSAVDCEEQTVTAGTSLTLAPQDASYPGGVGPGPFVAEEVHSSCTATATDMAGAVTIINGVLETEYDEGTQQPTRTVAIRENPEPNTVLEGWTDRVGDRYRITLNRQIENPDGSLTVNAVHMELLGPTAVGEVVIGQSTCGVTSEAPTTAAAPLDPAPREPAPRDSPVPADTAPQEAGEPTSDAPVSSPAGDEGRAPTTAAAAAGSEAPGSSTGGPRAPLASTDTAGPSTTERTTSRTNPFQVAQAGGETRGEAYNYSTDVSLFGGPSTVRGHGQGADAPATAESPSVECPAGGGADSATKPEGASAQYGPAVLFGGIWPESASSAPPSGPLTAEVDCDAESVTAATSVTAPGGSGGVGPGPVVADEVHSSCTATPDGPTAEVRFVGGVLETQYDETTQEPSETEPIPESPSPNTVREGTLDHVGDSYRVTFNRQTENADGSLTVEAVYMELLGPTAEGVMVIGSSTCGVGTTATDPGTTDGTDTGDGTARNGDGATNGTTGTGRTGTTDGRTGADSRDGQLARTGTDPLPTAALGLGLMLAGILMLQSGRLVRGDAHVRGRAG